MEEQGVEAIQVNEEGKRVVREDGMTLFYMPHCGHVLYNNVLWANWGPGVSRVCIVGNSFARIMRQRECSLHHFCASALTPPPSFLNLP